MLIIDRQEIFQAIELERDRQDRLHPVSQKKIDNPEIEAMANLIITSDNLAVLVEEVGEIASAIQGEGDLKEELIQTAAVCVRWLERLK